MFPSQFRLLKRKLNTNRKVYRSFLTKAEKKSPPGIDELTPQLEPGVWKEVACLSCANCCRTMTPTFTRQDITRIAAHFGQTSA